MMSSSISIDTPEQNLTPEEAENEGNSVGVGLSAYFWDRCTRVIAGRLTLRLSHALRLGVEIGVSPRP